MNRLPLSLAASAFTMFALSSCASSRDSSWSPEWRGRIGNVRLMPSRVVSGAYQKPSGVDTGISDFVGSRVYMASGGDNVVGFVSGLVSSRIAHGQQEDFEEKNRSLFPTLQQFFDAGFNSNLDGKLSQALDRTSFRDKRNEPYGSALHVEILKCGFTRVGVNNRDEVLLTPYAQVNFRLLSTDHKKKYLLHTTIFDAAYEGIRHTAREFAADPALRRRAQEVLTSKIGNALTEVVKKKLAEM